MAKKQVMMMAATGIVMFAAGFLARTVWGAGEGQEPPSEEQAAENPVEERKEEIEPEAPGYVMADKIRVRIEDNQVQWYDGRIWHSVASVGELEKEDRYYLAEEGFRAFDEQLMQEKAAKRQEEAGGEAPKALSVGVKETPKPAAKPQATVPQAPAEIPGQVAPPVDNGGNDSGSGGGNDGGGNPGNQNPGAGSGGASSGGTGSGGINSGEAGSGGGAVDPPPADVPADTGGGDTGDGENMEWSDDYL